MYRIETLGKERQSDREKEREERETWQFDNAGIGYTKRSRIKHKDLPVKKNI